MSKLHIDYAIIDLVLFNPWAYMRINTCWGRYNRKGFPMFALDTSRSVAPSFAYRTMNAAQNVFHAIVAWNEDRQTRNALSKLSWHELEDIGLSSRDLNDFSSFKR